MSDFQKCPGLQIEHKTLKLCQECQRRTAPSDMHQQWIEPKARRCGGGSWVCIWRKESFREVTPVPWPG